MFSCLMVKKAKLWFSRLEGLPDKTLYIELASHMALVGGAGTTEYFLSQRGLQ